MTSATDFGMALCRRHRRFHTAFLVGCAVLVASPAPSAGQAKSVLQLQVESVRLTNEYIDSRIGVGIAFGADAAGGGWRIRVSHLSQGDVDPGWQTFAAEVGPVLVPHSLVDLAIRIMSGGHRMQVSNRHAVIDGCSRTVGCFFEAPAFSQGWSWLAGGTLEGRIRAYSSVAVTAGISSGYLLSGANPDEWLRAWSVGVVYQF